MEPHYKDSGIPWIGQIPQHWEVLRFKSKFSTRKGLSITKADLAETGIPVINYGQIHSKLNSGTQIVPEILKYVPSKYIDSDKSSMVSKGDFIFADTSEDLDGCGNSVYVNIDGDIFAGYHAIIASGGEDNKYFSYLFQSDAWRHQVKSQVTGIKVYSISQVILSSTKLLVPPLEEQERIAAYLDGKCGEIDELIEVERQMIADLEAYRQSVITEAATHGLNPNAPTKPTNIPWLGDIPQHWEVCRVKDFSHIYSGEPLRQEEVSNEEKYPVFGGGDVLGYSKIFNNSNTLILGRVGGDGRVKYVKTNFWATDNALIINTYLNKPYLGHILSSADLLRLSTSTSQPLLTATKIKNVVIPLPPLGEQREIAEYLDGKCREIDELIRVKQQKIDTLKQYRQSLIFEVVTGKVSPQ